MFAQGGIGENVSEGIDEASLAGVVDVAMRKQLEEAMTKVYE